MVEIKYVQWGIANSYPKEDLIELHEDLNKPEFLELQSRILKHEKEHFQQHSWIGQRKVDFRTELSFKDLFPFIKTHKKSFFQQYSPIIYHKEKKALLFEWSIITLILLYAGLIALIIFLIKNFTPDSILFWRTIKYIVLILFGISIIYFGGKQLIKQVNKESIEVSKKKKGKV